MHNEVTAYPSLKLGLKVNFIKWLCGRKSVFSDSLLNLLLLLSISEAGRPFLCIKGTF